MDEEIQVQAIEAEAPPGDVAADTADVAVAEAPPEAAIEADYSNPAWVAAEEARINAEVLAAESAEATTAEDVADPAPVPATATAVQAVTAPASESAPAPEVDEAAALAALAARGYKVEAPPPPPDPYAELTGRLAPYVGTPEEYATTKAAALAFVPPEPTDYAPSTVEAHEAAVRARNEAAAKLQKMDDARAITGVSREWARQRVLGEEGAALQTVPSKYGLPPEAAQRVLQPTALTDAIDAVVESVTSKLNADWQAKYDARERHWQGEVKRASTDRAAESVRRMGAAPSAAGVQGGRPSGPGPIWEVDPKTGLPTEAAIQKAIRGDFAAVDMSDR